MENLGTYYSLWLVFRVLFIALVVMFFISGVDDLFLDLVYYVRLLYRKIFLRGVIKPVTLEQLSAVPEKPVAVMIPAWDESRVIGKMLLNTAATLNYRNYCIFVGAYPNDPATVQEVEKAREVFPNIEVVITPADGPTNKADCLNWIYQGILLYEKEHNARFEIFVLHDAEDIVHPLWLKYGNYLIPRIHFVQLPVFPLETPWYNWVAGVYKDEFAENHTKDLLAREILSATIPSAGVGTAMSRYTLEYLARERRNQLFDITSLTEDYLMGIRLQNMPGKKILLQQSVERKELKRNPITGEEYEETVKEPVATREFFPNQFRAAVRQKARWILGIALQGWSIGWTDSLGSNYCLYRDRKAVLTNLVVVLGYVVAAFWVSIWGANRLTPGSYIPPLIESNEPYFYLLLAVLGMFVWRLFNRVVMVWRIYGPMDAVMSVPRVVLGNLLNFSATVVAIRRFVSSKLSGKVPEWGKTDHAWPTEDQLQRYRRRLGNLLVERRLISTDQLDKALEEQKKTGRKLGEVLVEAGVLWEEDLMFELARQRNEQAVEVDPYSRPDLIDVVPRSLAEKYRVFPVGSDGHTLILATDNLEAATAKREEQAMFLGRPVAFRLTSGADMKFALSRAYRDKHRMLATPAERLGPRLVREGLVTEAELKEAVRKQKRTHQKLGEILVEMKVLSEEELSKRLGPS